MMSYYDDVIEPALCRNPRVVVSQEISLEDKKRYYNKVKAANYRASLRLEGFKDETEEK
ncbi:MAG: YhfG family protein [Dehalococcoidales bacterium]